MDRHRRGREQETPGHLGNIVRTPGRPKAGCIYTVHFPKVALSMEYVPPHFEPRPFVRAAIRDYVYTRPTSTRPCEARYMAPTDPDNPTPNEDELGVTRARPVGGMPEEQTGGWTDQNTTRARSAGVPEAVQVAVPGFAIH